MGRNPILMCMKNKASAATTTFETATKWFDGMRFTAARDEDGKAIAIITQTRRRVGHGMTRSYAVSSTLWIRANDTRVDLHRSLLRDAKAEAVRRIEA